MNCAGCGHQNREGAKFCEECGAPLGRVCPSCGGELRPTAKFCDSCGQALAAPPTPARDGAPPAPARADVGQVAGRIAERLTGYTPRHLAEKILTSRAALVGERKQVTVLFADVAGFTALSTQVDPEELHDIMDGCFRQLLDAVHRYEGTVNQFTGDGVMALFGAPVAHEDHALRGVAAALAVQEALAPYAERLRSERGVEFAVRIGLNTGPVVVGKIGDDLRMDYTAMGETVNLAARLQAAAPAGGVLVAEATEGAVRGFFEIEELAPLALKGFATTVRAFRISGRRRSRGRFEIAVERGLTPLVGRERELGLLGSWVGRAHAGRGVAISITGEPGIGKSRLAWELRRRFGESDWSVVAASCRPHGESLPFQVIADCLRGLLGFDGEKELSLSPEALDEATKEIDASLGWTAPWVEHLLGMPAARMESEGLDPAQRKRRMIEAFKTIVLRSAQRQPLAVVLDDLQWIDAGSEECLAALVDSLGQRPLLLVTTFRSPYRPPWEARSVHQRITLEPLDDAESRAMLDVLPGEVAVAAPVRGALLERAVGNPLFLEELGGYVRHRGDVAGNALPATVHDLVASRIDRLSEPLKATLQLVSVLGREFPLRWLEAMTGGEGGDVHEHVSELVHLELLQEVGLVPEIRYRFAHPMTREVAYQSLLVRSRSELHARAGEALERLYADRPDEVLPELARHYARGADAEKAMRFLLRAGDRAAGLFAYGEAETWYREALEASERCQHCERQRSVAWERIGDAASARGSVREAQSAWEQALATVDDDSRKAGLLRKLGVVLWSAGEPDAALDHLERGLAALGDDREGLEAARLHHERARIHFRLGAHEEAVAAATRALELGLRLDAPEVVSHAFTTLGLALARSGDIEGGIEHVEGSLRTALNASLGSAACRAYVNLAILTMTVDHDRSKAYCREGLDLARRIGDELQQSWLACALAAGHCSLGGDYDAGLRAAEEAIETDLRLGQRSHLPIPLILLGQIHQCRGDVDRSRRYYEEALEVAEVVGEPQLLIPCYEGLATLSLESDDEVEADRWLGKSRRVQEESGWSSDTSLLLPFVS